MASHQLARSVDVGVSYGFFAVAAIFTYRIQRRWRKLCVVALLAWPEARCAYLRFSDAYPRPYVEALRRRWLTRQIGAGHFHMLENPRYVAEALLEFSAAPVLRED